MKYPPSKLKLLLGGTMSTLSRRRILQLTISGSLASAQQAFAAAGEIDERSFVKIGGIEQWIAIQGSDRSNPAILYLHGGPGEAQSPFLDGFASWRQHFTVVNWDQRGAGKTYEKNGDATPDMTLERLVDDAIDLTEQMLKRLNKDKLVLVGQSAGSVLGLKATMKRPDLFHAFVGTGQFVSFIRTVEWQEKEANIPSTHDAAELRALRGWAIMSPPDQPYLARQKAFVGPPERPNRTAESWMKGYLFEAGKIGKSIEQFDAMTAALDLAVPYVLIQGREDRITPTPVAKAYFDQVRSTGKTFASINGGHFACFTNSGEFLAVLRSATSPFVQRG